MSISDLTNTKMFVILGDSSKETPIYEMKLAYQDFVEQTIVICTSNDYMHIFRVLNFTSVEIVAIKKWEKKCAQTNVFG